MENLKAVSLKEIFSVKEKFLIPKIQRGYRWSEDQIKRLLDDLEYFFTNADKNAYYCLQPLIIQKEKKEDGIIYNVIDGQQRLVTTYLFFYYLYEDSFERQNFDNRNNKNYEEKKYKGENQCIIKYENEKKSVPEIINDKKKDTLTKRFITEGYEKICSFLSGEQNNYSEIKPNNQQKLNNLLERIRFIYYELENKANEVEIFTNVNVGKLPLNTAEKVKGLMLKSDNFVYNGKDEKEKKYFENRLDSAKKMIVEEWSEIEHHLHDDSFFSFFTKDYNNEIRINLLFDVFAEKIKAEENSKKRGYDIIEDYLQENKIVDEKSLKEFWNKIKKIYYILSAWYKNDYTYHYIGYLIYFSDDYYSLIIELLSEYEKRDKSEFVNYLIEKIKVDFKNNLKKDINKLYYQDENGGTKDQLNIRKVLLLFNIENIVRNQKNEETEIEYKEENIILNERFDFKRFKSAKYQLEHIHSQSDSIRNKEEWLMELYKYKDTLINISVDKKKESDLNKLKSLLAEIEKSYNKIIEKSPEVQKKELNVILKKVYFPKDVITDIIGNDDKFNEVAKSIELIYIDEYIGDNKHSIANLTLLDSATNESYGNKIFPIKVSIIKETDRTTRFIPVATRNVMLKYYTKNPENNLCWNKKDMVSYLDCIKEYLKKYIEEKN